MCIVLKFVGLLLDCYWNAIGLRWNPSALLLHSSWNPIEMLVVSDVLEYYWNLIGLLLECYRIAIRIRLD